MYHLASWEELTGVSLWFALSVLHVSQHLTCYTLHHKPLKLAKYIAGHCLETKVFVGKLPTGVGDHRVGRPIMKGGHGPTKEFQDVNWDPRNARLNASQLMSYV